MKKTIITVNLFVFIGLLGCSPTSKTTDNTSKWKPQWRMQAGINHGGIVENTDFTKNTNISPDAFSGATKVGVNAGAHVLLPVYRNAVETGVDYMYNNQTFTYSDLTNNYLGTHKIGVSQFMIPITYNIGLFKNVQPMGLVQLKFGYVCQFNVFSFQNNGASLPKYSTNGFSNGATLGLSSTPIKLQNGSKLGFYMDMYRGSKVFDDFYNSKIYEMPATSYFKAGIIFQFGK